VGLCILAGCETSGSPGGTGGLDTALRGKGAQHTITFTRDVTTNQSTYWLNLFCQYAMVGGTKDGPPPQGQQSGVDFPSAARQAETDTIRHFATIDVSLGGGVMQKFVQYDGQDVN